MDIINSIEHEQLKSTIPDIKIGDTVRVHQRIKEGNRERIQVFEGIVIKKQNGGLNETFTVRRISYGVGVEKTFLMHSPLIEKIEVIRVGKVRRAKLYYLRDRVGKAAKTKEKVGARIETNEIVVKEEIVPGEADVVEEVTEVVPGENEVVETAETVEVVETAPAEDVSETEEAVEVAEESVEAVAEEVKEEAAEPMGDVAEETDKKDAE